MKGHFSHAQRHAIRLAKRGPLIRCKRGYESNKHAAVAAATVNSLIARGWLVVSRATGTGDPLEVIHTGTQIEFPFGS